MKKYTIKSKKEKTLEESISTFKKLLREIDATKLKSAKEQLKGI